MRFVFNSVELYDDMTIMALTLLFVAAFYDPQDNGSESARSFLMRPFLIVVAMTGKKIIC